MVNAIETEGLTKYYGKSRGIIDVSLVVESGQIFGFLGPNGAGKSTTIRLLLDLIRPTSGHARVLGGRPPRSPGHRPAGRLMPGELSLYGDMTGRPTPYWATCRQVDGAYRER
jgi:ABC-2 type transport system ATP-binding protein